MSAQKTIAVLGITGKQGGSVAESLLKEGKWKIRGLTRDATKPESKALSDKGIELIQGNANNKDDLRKLFKGADAVFAITMFWDPSQMGKEVESGKQYVDVAKEEKVAHFVWSTLVNVEKISNGKYHVPHFTDKALVDDYIKQAGLRATFIAPAFFFQNFNGFFVPKKDENGVYVFSLPGFPGDKLITSVDIDHIGEAVKNIVNNPSEWEGKWIPYFSEHMTINDYVAQFTQVTGQKGRYQAAPSGVAGEEIQQMLDWFAEFTYFGPDHSSFPLSKKVDPSNPSWKEFIKSGNLKY